jgi:CheY-like chemotaxis protein
MPPGRRVLIVEDDLDLRRIIAAFLEDESFEIDAAGSGVDALRSIERNPPSCIVLDVFLPVMTGWELADELKRRGLAIPIVVITAARDARHWAERIGAVSYVPKPISLPSLVRRVDEICA